MAKSLSLTSAMIFCRSSRFFGDAHLALLDRGLHPHLAVLDEADDLLAFSVESLLSVIF